MRAVCLQGAGVHVAECGGCALYRGLTPGFNKKRSIVVHIHTITFARAADVVVLALGNDTPFNFFLHFCSFEWDAIRHNGVYISSPHAR